VSHHIQTTAQVSWRVHTRVDKFTSIFFRKPPKHVTWIHRKNKLQSSVAFTQRCQS